MPEIYVYNKNDLVIFFGDLIYIESLIILAIFKNKITICLSYFILTLTIIHLVGIIATKSLL